MKDILTVVISLVLFWLVVTSILASYFNTPTVYIDLDGKCVAVETKDGSGHCNNMPIKYITVLTNVTMGELL
jgi:hypothetical protein